MTAAHSHLDITSDDWEIFRNLLNETFHALRFLAAERRDMVDFTESLRAEIVHG